MPKGKASKPKKPYADFTLTAHANGQWCKKIRGKVHFFGIWGEADAALQKYLDQRDDLQAGRIPQRVSSGVVNVGSLVNLFLAQWEAKVQSGTISLRTFVDYRDCAKMLIVTLGRSTAAETLAPINFAGLRNQWAGKYSSGRLNKLSRPSLKGLQRLAIDENYLGKRHGFVTVVLDFDSKAIVAVVKGRGKMPLREVFALLKASRAKIKSVATDMAGGYIAAVMEGLPKAKLVFDHFHVVKLMNEKLTALRREMYNELTDQLHKQVLKGTRWLLLRNPENLRQNEKVDEKAKLQEALKLNAPLATAYYLKEDLREFWKQGSKPAAEKHLEAWCRRAEASGIRQMQTMAKTLRAHRTGLLNWYDDPISTGPLEGINNKIGALQRRAYGYRNYEHLKEKLLTLHHTKFMLQG